MLFRFFPYKRPIGKVEYLKMFVLIEIRFYLNLVLERHCKIGIRSFFCVLLNRNYTFT